MKRFLLCVGLACLSVLGFSQEIPVAKKVPTAYDRSSLSVFFFRNQAEKHSNAFLEKAEKIVFPDKYNNNNFPSIILNPDFSRASVNKGAEIRSMLAGQNVAPAIVGLWYNRQSDGTMNTEIVHQRGRFSATDEDFIKAQATKRGNSALEDFGNRLINLSYILVIDAKEIRNVKELGMTTHRGWRANISGYLYRIKFDEEVQNEFYDTWIYEDDSPEVIAEKKSKFDRLNVPIELVTEQIIQVDASQSEDVSGLGLLVKPKTEDELMQELAQKSLDELIYQFERKVEEFKVKTSIYDVRPIRSKIGMKEGVKTDYRFYVYEFVWNDKKSIAEPKRRGVVRATSKIVDNRQEASGDMGTTQFYQVAGLKLESGFTMQQQNDLGLEVTPGFEIGGLGGAYIRGDVRMGRYIGMRATFVYVEGGVDGGEYFNDNYSFLRVGGGLAKGFQLGSNLELRPFAGAGIERATSEALEAISIDYLELLYMKLGANLALNLTHNFQIVGGLGSYIPIGDATDPDGNEYGSWEINFEDRKGISLFLGVKAMF